MGRSTTGMARLDPVLLPPRRCAKASPESPLTRVLATQAGIVLGLVMALIILLVLHDRRRALRGASTATR
jgi:hypothetical protein